MRLFHRSVQVAIAATDEASGITIEDTRIEFDIKREAQKKPARGNVSLWNLSAEHAQRLDHKGVVIAVLAGYRGRLDLILRGVVRRVEHERQELNRIVKIAVGGLTVRDTTVNGFSEHSYTGDVPLAVVVADAARDLGLSLSTTDILPADVLTDFAFSGQTTDLLTEILRPRQIEWFEDSGTMRFSLAGADIDDRSSADVPVLSPNTGMVGTPTVTDEGLRVRHLLRPDLNLGGRVKVNSVIASGSYKVVGIVHRGNNRRGDFFTEVDLRKLATETTTPPMA